MISNLFTLHAYQIPLQTAIDMADRAIGNYGSGESSAWRRTFNPFFWFGLALDYVAALPFQLARRAGFNPQPAETSGFGRIVRIIVWSGGTLAGLVAFVAAVVGLLQAFGWWDAVLIRLGLEPIRLPSPK